MLCPLCGTHLDNQQLSMQCPVIKKNVTVKGDMSDIYKEDINIEIIQTISKISEFRKEIGPCVTEFNTRVARNYLCFPLVLPRTIPTKLAS